MRVEVRKSDGPACETCGATEVVATKLGKPLVWDAGRLFAQERKQLERELREEYERRLYRLDDDGRRRALAARKSIQELEAHHYDVRVLAAKGVQDLVGKEYARIRFRARRRQRKLIAEAGPIIDALLANTAKV